MFGLVLIYKKKKRKKKKREKLPVQQTRQQSEN